MENFPKIISSVPEKKDNDNSVTSNTYVNCNVCRNFSNILKLSHRRSKEHQEKMTEKFKVLRKRIRALSSISVTVHNEEWQKKEALFCYFCDKPIKKHEIKDELMVESLGYMTHVASPEHAKAVKVYLKFHGREENYELFCKTKKELEKFVDKIPEAREKYLKEQNYLHAKAVQAIKDVEEQRKELVTETVQNSVVNIESNVMYGGLQSSSSKPQPFIQKHDSKLEEKCKVPPWQIMEDGNKNNKVTDIAHVSVIGPTIETFNKHVAAQTKKGLPSSRLGAKRKLNGEYSAGWMPDFRGVWNKGKRKYLKSRATHKK